jgi:branched-subunit amino acid aminotransferase/4-amino-4-deoxychorismate lyase
MDEQGAFIILNGKPVRASEAMVPASTGGLSHGTGAFETFLAERNSVFMFDEHIGRLNRGLAWLGFDASCFPDIKKTRELITQLLRENGLEHTDARVRIQVSSAEKGGYGAAPVRSVSEVITAEAVKKNPDPIRLKTSQTRVVPSACRPAELKLSNMLHYRQAWREARSAGYDDALMLTTGGFIAESAIANILWRTGDTIYTPDESCDILPGVMRSAVMRVISGIKKLEVSTGRFSPEKLMDADEVWLTNSVMEVHPVYSVDDTVFKPEQPVLKQIREGLNTMKKHYSL